MKRTHIYVLSGFLTLLGIGIFLYKALALGFPLKSGELRTTWRVEARVEFVAEGKAVKVDLFIPQNSTGFSIQDQSFVAPGYGVTSASVGPNTVATYTIGKATGEQILYYRAVLDRWREQDRPSRPPDAKITLPNYEGAAKAAADAIVKETRDRSADTPTFVALMVKRLRERSPNDAANILLGRNPTEARLVRVTVELLNLAGIPAISVHGVDLTHDRRLARVIHWFEVQSGKEWAGFDPKSGLAGVPDTWLPWWRGQSEFATVTGGGKPTRTISVNRRFQLALTATLHRERSIGSQLFQFSLFGLPLATQEVYRQLMVIPIGVLFLAFLRNVIGIKTFGTFMPVLIAIAFRQTDVLIGVILFSVVLGIGLAVRSYMETLKLLLVPRLAAVVIVVILLMAMISIVSYRMGIESGLSVALFPIVILAMTIERASIVWEERGPKEAFQQIVGSLAVAALCYTIMNIGQVEYMAFVFPELILVVLALTVLLGRYSGYRLTELPRFRILAKPR